MKIEIEYCVPCGYLDRAIDAQRTVLTTCGGAVASVTLIPGAKGVFTITADGETIYSKPDEYDITRVVETIKARLEA